MKQLTEQQELIFLYIVFLTPVAMMVCLLWIALSASRQMRKNEREAEMRQLAGKEKGLS